MDKKITVDEFISEFPDETQAVLLKIRSIISEAMPEAEEDMSYGVPTFKLNGKNLIHYSAFKHHIGLYPGPEAIKALSSELTEYKTAPGTIRFPLNRPIPYDLIKNITVWCTNQHQE